MSESYVTKEKVIREFKEEIKEKKRLFETFDSAFFDILNKIFKLKPNELKCTISSKNTLVFAGKKNEYFIYLEWFPTSKPESILNITPEEGAEKEDLIQTGDLDANLIKLKKYFNG